MNEGEEWRPVVGYEGVYSVSSLGRVRRAVAQERGARLPAGYILKPCVKPSGQATVSLSRDGRMTSKNLARTVAAAFLGPRPPSHMVKYWDGDARNHRAANLYYQDPKGYAVYTDEIGGRASVTPETRREGHRRYQADWRERNRDKSRAAVSRWQEKNPGARRRWLEANKDRALEARLKWQAANPRFRYRHALKVKYGLTLERYEQMVADQGGRCAVCDRVPTGKGLVVDHDHATGRVRGLLCNPCNLALGYLKDNTATLQRAVTYLRKTEDPPCV